MITLVTDKQHIESGQFPLNELQDFSRRTGARVIIRNYAVIENGTIRFMLDKSMILCEALRAVQNDVRNLSCRK